MTSMFIENSASAAFNRRTRVLRSAGVELPAECAQILDRLQSFERHAGTPMRDRLIDAVASGDETADIGMLAALAIAESSPGKVELGDAVRAAMNQRVRAAYAKHAADIHRSVADRFDTAAAAFVKVASQFDPESDPEAAVEASSANQRAWKAAAAHAAELNKLTTPLLDAALLAGIPGGSDNPAAQAGMFTDRISEKDMLLSLCVDTSGHDRQQLWDAWDVDEVQAAVQAQANQGFTVQVPRQRRCGRWSALWSAGITIRAADLDAYEPYGRTDPVPVTPEPEPEPVDSAPPSSPKGRVYYASGRSIPVG